MEAEDMKTERLEHLIAFILNVTNSLKLLTQCALDFQSLGIAKKHHIEEAIDQAEDLEEILGMMIKLLKKTMEDYWSPAFEQGEDLNSCQRP